MAINAALPNALAALVTGRAGFFVRPVKSRNREMGLVGSLTASSLLYMILPTGKRYHNLYIDIASTTCAASDLTFVVKLDGEQIMSFTGDQIDSFNQQDGLGAMVANTGRLLIPFDLPVLDERLQVLTAINVGSGTENSQQAGTPAGIQQLRLEVKLSANVVAMTNFQVYSETSEINTEQSLFIPRIDTFNQNPAASKNNQAFNKPLVDANDKTRQFVWRFALNDTVGHVTRLQINEDGSPVHDMDTAVYDRFIAQNVAGAKTAQTSWRSWDASAGGGIHDALHVAAINRLDVLMDTGAGASSPMLTWVQTLGTKA